MRATIVLLLLAAAAAPSPAVAQSEDQLRTFFEGKTVRVKIEMPGTEDGVDVYPGTAHPIDFPKHATRLKRSGTALRRGDEVLVTKVKVKKDLIEFQLGGGGYGTFGDDDSPNVFVPSAPKTEREKNLEKDLEKTTDPTQRRKMSEELDALRRDRQRENARNQAEAAQATQTKEANIRQRRLEGGSRFNIRYQDQVPYEALTPQSVMVALGQYVDFSQLRAGEPEPATSVPGATAQPLSTSPNGPGSLRKGMLLPEVDALLGPPASSSDRKEGSLKVAERVYSSPNGRVTAWFVEGVLIRYTMTSE